MRRTTITGMICALVIGMAALPAMASTLQELKDRFKQRLPEIQQLKTNGKVGETFKGYLEAVKADSLDETSAKLVKAENADRSELYKSMAEKTNAKPEDVATRNAARNFQNAKAGEYLKGNDGAWKKKQ